MNGRPVANIRRASVPSTKVALEGLAVVYDSPDPASRIVGNRYRADLLTGF